MIVEIKYDSVFLSLASFPLLPEVVPYIPIARDWLYRENTGFVQNVGVIKGIRNNTAIFITGKYLIIKISFTYKNFIFKAS